MRALRLRLGEADLAGYAGAVVATNVRGGGQTAHVLRKGYVLRAEDLPGLAALAAAMPHLTVPLLLLDPGDIHEDEAAMRLGQLLAGPGVAVRGPAQGKVRLVTLTRGLLRVDAALLGRLNRIPDVSVYTLFDRQPVEAGTTVAEAKCVPLVIAGQYLEEATRTVADAHATGAEPLTVAGFRPARAALLIRERLDGATRDRVRAGLAHKLAWFGAALLPDDLGAQVVPDRSEAVIAALRAVVDAGADLVLTAGGSSSDPFDAARVALAHLGAAMILPGVPIHPGSLLWVAYWDNMPIVGVPSCGLLSEQTAFDLILPRLLAEVPAALRDVPDMAVGGLLAPGSTFRFPPYGELPRDEGSGGGERGAGHGARKS